MAPMDAVLSVGIAHALHFVAPHHPYRRACDIAYDSKNYLKWQAIQLAIHSTVGI